jgi:hypothetical protein|tara:strand:- start:843 stop:1235 length:393 start_codon:yes stop_codon:yes gene_type:complete
MPITLNLDIAQEMDITARKGDSFTFDIVVKDSDGTAKDLSSYTFNMDVRLSSDKSTRNNVFLSTSTSKSKAPIIISGLANGTMTVSATSVAMSNVEAGAYLYDIQANLSTTSQTWFYGSFTVNADISDYI